MGIWEGVDIQMKDKIVSLNIEMLPLLKLIPYCKPDKNNVVADTLSKAAH